MKKLICLLMFSTLVLGSTTLIYPENHPDYHKYPEGKRLLEKNEISFLGDVAPGQTLSLVFDRFTGKIGEERMIYWEYADVDKDILKSSELRADKIALHLTIPLDTMRGSYAFNATLKGSEIGLIATETYSFKLNIKEDVYDFVFDSRLYLQAGEPTYVDFKIKSCSVAPDKLSIIGVDGLPSKWISMDQVQINSTEEKTVFIKITPMEEGFYTVKFDIGRESSVLKDRNTFYARVHPTPKSKLQGFSEGFAIIPILLQPFYSLLALFGLI